MAITLRVYGKERARKKIARWLKASEDDALKIARGLAAIKLELLIRNSPQYSGDFAVNWNFSLNKIDRTHYEDLVPPQTDGEPYQQFDAPAFKLGMAKNLLADNNMKLGDAVYISNFSTHYDNQGQPDAYYKKILDGTLSLRDVNMKVSLEAALQKYNDKYAKRVTPRQLAYVKGRRAGKL